MTVPEKCSAISDGDWTVFPINYDVFGVSWCRAALAHTMEPLYSRAGKSTASYVQSYQVTNTLLRINYLTCLVSTMVSSGFGPYHGLWLEVAPTKCICVILTPSAMRCELGLV